MVKITSKINKDVLKINKKTCELKKSSIFTIVINPNKSYATDYHGKMKAIEDMFLRFCKYIFAESRFMKLIKCACCRGQKKCTLKELENKIESINCVTSVEAGSRNKFLHSNTTVNVIHKAKIHINIQRIRDIANLYMGKVIPNANVYVGVQCATDNLYNNMQYVNHSKEIERIVN